VRDRPAPVVTPADLMAVRAIQDRVAALPEGDNVSLFLTADERNLVHRMGEALAYHLTDEQAEEVLAEMEEAR
jgi:hypothetical protein